MQDDSELKVNADRVVQVTVGDKWTTPLAQYENRSPLVSFSETITIPKDTPFVYEDYVKKLWEKVNGSIKEIHQGILNDQKKEVLIDDSFRIKDGKKYVRVTKVITPIPPDVPNLELYGLRGDILHRIFGRWVSEGKYIWDVTKEEEEKLNKIGGLPKSEWDLQWIADLGYDFSLSEQEVYSDEYMYCGRYDCKGADTLYDIKSGNPTKEMFEKAKIQLSAYAKCLPEVKRLVVIPVNPKAKHQPQETTDIDKYFSVFLKKRAEFKDRYGL